jgi:hypothetical protein
MIKDPQKLYRFENELMRSQPLDIDANFRIFEALYSEARELGIFPLKNPMEGIEHDIRLAKALNSV